MVHAWAAAFPICTRPGTFNGPKLSTSMGQTLTHTPQPMQDEFALVIGSCFKAKLITSIPTRQFLEHSMQVMHLSAIQSGLLSFDFSSVATATANTRRQA